MIHDIKILPIYFEAVALGIKTFEVRKDDRPYQVGDTLLLREYGNGEFTGKNLKAKVTYILRDSAFCKDGYCIMGIKEVDRNKYISRADVEAICHDIYLRSDEWTNEGITAIDTADEILERVDEKIKEKESENNFNDTDIDADVQPVKHGWWITKAEDYYKAWQDSGRSWDDMPYFITGKHIACSECFTEYDVCTEGIEHWIGCPCCLAKMDGDAE